MRSMSSSPSASPTLRTALARALDGRAAFCRRIEGQITCLDRAPEHPNRWCSDCLMQRASELLATDARQTHDAAPQATAGTEELREQLAALAHDQWSGWMRYMFSRCGPSSVSAGQMYIPREWVERWQRQMDTPYAELSETEKDSDRKEADRVLALLPPASGADRTET